MPRDYIVAGGSGLQHREVGGQLVSEHRVYGATQPQTPACPLGSSMKTDTETVLTALCNFACTISVPRVFSGRSRHEHPFCLVDYSLMQHVLMRSYVPD